MKTYVRHPAKVPDTTAQQIQELREMISKLSEAQDEIRRRIGELQEEVRQLRNEMLEDKKKHEDDKKKDEEEIGNMKLEMDDLRETLLAATSKVSNFELGYKNDQLKAKLATFESKPLIYILCLYYTYSSKLVLQGLTDWSENPIYFILW